MLGTKSDLSARSRGAAVCSAPVQGDAAAHRDNGRVGAGGHLTRGGSADIAPCVVLRLVSVVSILQAALSERRLRAWIGKPRTAFVRRETGRHEW
jgi:hypothetical protein